MKIEIEGIDVELTDEQIHALNGGVNVAGTTIELTAEQLAFIKKKKEFIDLFNELVLNEIVDIKRPYMDLPKSPQQICWTDSDSNIVCYYNHSVNVIYLHSVLYKQLFDVFDDKITTDDLLKELIKKHFGFVAVGVYQQYM